MFGVIVMSVQKAKFWLLYVTLEGFTRIKSSPIWFTSSKVSTIGCQNALLSYWNGQQCVIFTITVVSTFHGLMAQLFFLLQPSTYLVNIRKFSWGLWGRPTRLFPLLVKVSCLNISIFLPLIILHNLTVLLLFAQEQHEYNFVTFPFLTPFSFQNPLHVTLRASTR